MDKPNRYTETKNCHSGVKMTSIEDMEFSFWLDKQDFTMNTLEREERTKVVQTWLDNNRKIKNEKNTNT